MDAILDAIATRGVKLARTDEQLRTWLTERAVAVAVESTREEMGRIRQGREQANNTILKYVFGSLSNETRRCVGKAGEGWSLVFK